MRPTTDLSALAAKIILSVLSRSGIRPRRLYLPSLRQIIYDPVEITSAFSEIFIKEIYRPVGPLPAGCKIVDIGAHTGMFAIYALLRLRASQIRCFEPNPHSFRYLTANVAAARNPQGAQIAIYELAVAKEAGPIQLFIPRDCSTSVATTTVVGMHSAEDVIEVRSRAITLAEAVGERCDFLKIDAEGVEYDLLMDEMVRPLRIGEIAVEVHKFGKRWNDFLRLIDTLTARKYRVFDFRGELLTSDAIRTFCQLEDQAMVLHFA